MRIVIFGGTTEGRLLSHALAALGGTVTVCVATEYGREEQGEAEHICVLAGRKDAAGMAAVLGSADLCVDATHPYAKEASQNIRLACEQMDVPCLRLVRGKSEIPPNAKIFSSAAAAAEWLRGTGGNILLTTGTKELEKFSALGGARIYPRVLPLPESLAACEAAGIPRGNVLALQGPFSQELNEALIHQFKIQYLVTKDGGKAGGFSEKAAAAAAAGIRLLVIRRPEEEGLTYEEIMARCREMMICR